MCSHRAICIIHANLKRPIQKLLSNDSARTRPLTTHESSSQKVARTFYRFFLYFYLALLQAHVPTHTFIMLSHPSLFL
eukprot:m.8647 g.8647  ORF g.8647 m.8647 type:complete len:78 (-) comp5382_c0_seq1:259-492(-)